MTNPFEIIEARLNNIESLLFDLKFTNKREPIKEPESLTIVQVLDLLRENGYPTTQVQLYKLTHLAEIPASRIGKRLIFSRTELLNWLESRKVTKVSQQRKAAEKLASSARKRERARV